MTRIKIIKPYKKYQPGEVVSVSPQQATALIGDGIAIMTKDLAREEIMEAISKNKIEVPNG